MQSSGHDLTANRLRRATQPPTQDRGLVVPGPAAEEPDAADAHTHLRMISQAHQGAFSGNPAAAPASALADRCLSLGAHRHSRLPEEY